MGEYSFISTDNQRGKVFNGEEQGRVFEEYLKLIPEAK